jgi:hypothetical protein
VATYRFSPDERPVLPGAPFTPRHTGSRRVAYAVVGVVLAIAATFPNALVQVNVGTIAGSLGLYVAQASLLPAIYVAMNASANLTLIKARAQFGIPAVAHGLLIVYAAVALLQLVVPGFAASMLIRAVSGVFAALLITLSIYYLMQAFPPGPRGPLAIVIGLGLIQVGSPLARQVPVELLAQNSWRVLHLLELATALGVLVLIAVVRLPPVERTRAFEMADLVTIGLATAGLLLLCGVIGTGRILWWTDTPVLGLTLAASVPLFILAWVVEIHRRRPLMQFAWLGSADIVRFAIVALVVRFALAEQTYGSVGLLTSGGLTNDQLRTLFAIVAVAMLAGTAAAALTLSLQRVPWQIMVAALIISVGAWMDAHSTNLTRPEQLYFSQALLGFGTTLFIGPALLSGFQRMLSRGPDYFISIIVLFSVTQNVGGLAGSAALGTYQTIQAKSHAAALSEDLLGAHPNVVERIGLGAAAVADVVVDPAQRTGQGVSQLAKALAQEANVLAYNDVFILVSIVALIGALYVGWPAFGSAVRRPQLAAEGPG